MRDRSRGVRGLHRLVRTAAALLPGLIACGELPSEEVSPSHANPGNCPARTVEVLVFNIEYGGTLVDFSTVVAAIQRTGAELVAIEEAYGNLERLAEELGWPFFDRRTHIVSRLPLLPSSNAEGIAFDFVEISPGCVAVIANVHLPDEPSGDALRRRGAPVEEIVALEQRARMPMLEPVVRGLSRLVAEGLPAILAGDFNASSHLDDGFPWPTSLAMEAATFSDVYRTGHPDATTTPGFTWWARRPAVDGWNPDPSAPQTRIDFLYAAGDVEVLAARLLGEPGGRDVDIPIDPWVSDHRGVTATLRVQPFPSPPLVGIAAPGVHSGSTLTFRIISREDRSSLVLRPSDAGEQRLALQPAIGVQSIVVPSGGLRPGPGEALLVDAAGVTHSRTNFWVLAGPQPSIASDRNVYAVGETITATWNGAEGNRWDWIGVYPDTFTSPADDLLIWRHIGALVAGSAQLDGNTGEGRWPLPAGAYRLVLGRDDSYRILAECRFTIR